MGRSAGWGVGVGRDRRGVGMEVHTCVNGSLLQASTVCATFLYQWGERVACLAVTVREPPPQYRCVLPPASSFRVRFTYVDHREAIEIDTALSVLFLHDNVIMYYTPISRNGFYSEGGCVRSELRYYFPRLKAGANLFN